jgi:hypothetical protein
MTGRTAASSDDLLAEVFRGFLSSKENARRSVNIPGIISLSPLSLATNVTNVTLGANGRWLGTRTGTGGIVTLTLKLFGRSPYFHGVQVVSKIVTKLKSNKY